MPLLRGGDEEEREDRSRVPEVEVPGVRGVDHGLVRRRRREARGVPGMLMSKGTRLSMPGQGRTFRRRTAEFWRVWPMPEPTGEAHRVLFVDGIWLSRDLVVLIAHDGEHVVSWYMAQAEASRAWEALMAPIPAPDVVVCDGGTGFEKARRRAWPGARVQRCLLIPSI